MPNVNPNESQKDYISRCIPIVMHEGTTKDPKQAAAICHSKWREHLKNKASEWVKSDEHMHDNLMEAEKYLKLAIDRHKRHMNGSEPTDEKSQQLLMEELEEALEYLIHHKDEMMM